MDLESILLPMFVLWLLGLLFTVFRGGMEMIWKIPAVLISVFYVIWFRNELGTSLHHYQENFALSFVAFLTGLGHAGGLILFLLWPVVLLYSGYAASSSAARGFLRFMVIVTLLYWIFWFVDHFVYTIPVGNLTRVLPEKLHFEMPKPPSH